MYTVEIGKHYKSGFFLFHQITSCYTFAITSLHPIHRAFVRIFRLSVCKALRTVPGILQALFVLLVLLLRGM